MATLERYLATAIGVVLLVLTGLVLLATGRTRR